MLALDIPGFGHLRLEHLVCDYNGTLAVDGRLLPGVSEGLRALAATLQLHVVTADTFGRAAEELAPLPLVLTIIPVAAQAQAKQEYVSRLGAGTVAAIGNGRNDCAMLRTAALGIALVQQEGGAAQTIASAHVVCCSILDAFALLQRHERLVATLRA